MKLEASLMWDCTSDTFGVKLKRYSDFEGSLLFTVIDKSGGSFTFSGISSRFLVERMVPLLV